MVNIINRSLNSWELIFLGIFSFFTRFFSLDYPTKVVFDESHFGLYATKYLSHYYFFDIHPPLGKLLIALSGFLGNVKPGFEFVVNSDYLDLNFLALRFFPAFLGSLLVVLLYLFVKELGFSRRVAFLVGFLVLFENAILVQSRLILLDSILLFFIFLSLYLFLLIRKCTLFSKKWYLVSVICGLALGAAVSVKWTGFGALAIVWFWMLFEDKLFSRQRKEILLKIGLLLLIPVFFYILIFVIHFSIASTPCMANCGYPLDQWLENENMQHMNNPIDGNLPTRLIETNKLMLGHNLNPALSYLYQSPFYTWPFMMRPVLYFKDSQDVKSSFIYFFGNPIIWWFGILGILAYLYSIIKNYFYKFKMKIPLVFYSKNMYFLLLGFVAYFIPFATVPRFMLIYHYLPALIFSLIIFSVFFEGAMRMLFGPSSDDKILFDNKKANILFVGILFLILASFIFFLPFVYGTPLTESEFQSRIWFETWGILR